MPAFAPRVLSQSNTYEGPFWIFVHASGGFDPRFLFDPTDAVEQNRLYTGLDQVGSIPCATWSLDPERWNMDPTLDYGEYLLTPKMFLERLGSRLTVVNGLDTRTNNHDSGRRAMGSGDLEEGFPALGALVAWANAPRQPLAFMGGGGFDATQGLVPVVRLAGSSALQKIAYPNRMNADEPDSDTYHSDATWNRIKQAQEQRLRALRDAQTLPGLRQSMDELMDARDGDRFLKRLELPELVSLPGPIRDVENLVRQGQLAAASFKAGLSVSAALSIGGFDTHGNHDRDQSRQLAKLLGGVQGIVHALEQQGVADETFVVVTSDFARGPAYNGTNDGSGKDHWPVTSMFALGPGIAGDRLVGATTAEQQARAVDRSSLQPTSKGGVVITPAHIHVALREIAQLEPDPAISEYRLAAESLPIFG